jgi:hypothetical protein
MKINKSSTIQDVFEQFSMLFPYLKLEFYRKGHQANEGSSIEDQISHQTKLSQMSPDVTDSDFNIDGDMTVSDFEKYVKDKFQMNVQVFRKSSDLWLQTTATDHWTLNKQNGKGQRSTADYDIEPIDITDFDIE